MSYDSACQKHTVTMPWYVRSEQQSMIIPSAKEENKSLPPPPKASSPMKFAADLAAGGTAGGLSKTVVAPIERVKLLLQTQVAY